VSRPVDWQAGKRRANGRRRSQADVGRAARLEGVEHWRVGAAGLRDQTQMGLVDALAVVIQTVQAALV
jgi:hypothetical protein